MMETMAVTGLKSPAITTLLFIFSRKNINTKYIFLSLLHRKTLAWKMIKRKSEVKQKSSCNWYELAEPCLPNQPINVFLRDIQSWFILIFRIYSICCWWWHLIKQWFTEKERDYNQSFNYVSAKRWTLQPKLQPLPVYHGRITYLICFVFSDKRNIKAVNVQKLTDPFRFKEVAEVWEKLIMSTKN